MRETDIEMTRATAIVKKHVNFNKNSHLALGKINVFVNFIFQEYTFCIIAQLLALVIFVSLSPMRENLRGLREK